MKNIQILLLTMLVVGAVLFFTRNRTRLIDRIFVLAFVLVANQVLRAFGHRQKAVGGLQVTAHRRCHQFRRHIV